LAVAAMAAGLCALSTAEASAQNYATGTGWISADGAANNSDFNGGVTNNYAGWENQQYNNWFAFNIPNAPIGAASISIWNSSASSTLDPDAVYTLYEASAFTFGGLVGGSAALGSVTLGVANTGVSEYITINLNSTAVSLLNASVGGQFVFGGTITTSYSDPNSTFDQISAWGYTDGTPVAYLTTSPVPEPSTWAMMLFGFGGLGFAGYRRTLKGAEAAAKA
jgi:hypothetical protein